MNTLLLPEEPVHEILEESLGFVRSASGLTLSAELDGISFLAGEIPGAWTLCASWHAKRTAAWVESIIPAQMAPDALIAAIFCIWRDAHPDRPVPALLAAGADYEAWKAARARMARRRLWLYVDRRSLRIVCRKVCGIRFGQPRLDMVTLRASEDRLILSYRGQEVSLPVRSTWLGSVSVNADAFCKCVEPRSRRPDVELSFDQGRLLVGRQRFPAVWDDDAPGS